MHCHIGGWTQIIDDIIDGFMSFAAENLFLEILDPNEFEVTAK